MLNRDAAERWIFALVQPTAPIEVTRVRPWATVLRVPLAGGAAWFKACSAVQVFEPRLSAELFARWPDRVGEVLAYDTPRGWLLLADAGIALRELGNPPEAWLDVLPLYAELQRGEAVYAGHHIAHGVPSLPISTLPVHYAGLLDRDLPLEPDELGSMSETGAFGYWTGRQLSLAPVLLACRDLPLPRRTHRPQTARSVVCAAA